MDPQTNQLAFDILKELNVAELVRSKHGNPPHQMAQILKDYLEAFDTVRKGIKGAPPEMRTFEGPGMTQ